MDNIFTQLRHFLDYSRTVRRNTLKTVHDMEVSFQSFSEFSQVSNFSDFDAEAIENWIANQVTTREWKAKTVRTRLGHLSLFADFLVRRGRLEKNPVKAVPRPRLPKSLPRALTGSQCDRVMDWVRSFSFKFKFERMRAVAIIAMFMATGMRHSELRNLKMCDIDLDRMELFVRSGKGEKDRRIPFRPSLGVVLERYLQERTRLKKSCPEFFTAMRQNSKMGPKVIYRLSERLRKASGIAFTPHVFRHSYATRMLESGLSIREVQELLGHSHISTTVIYLAVTGERLTEQVRLKGFDV